MTTLKQALEKNIPKTTYEHPLIFIGIKNAVKEWIQQKRTCKIPCENCFLSVQCPYPKIWEDLET